MDDRKQQMIRNGRWGTCVDCPRDAEGRAYPEQCPNTHRADHWLTSEPREPDAAALSLAELQREIATRWGASEYGPAYLERRDPQRDAHHALLHVTKATGDVAALLDDLDHADAVVSLATRDRAMTGRKLADIVICAARIAETWPGARIDLAAAVADRLAAKFPPKGG